MTSHHLILGDQLPTVPNVIFHKNSILECMCGYKIQKTCTITCNLFQNYIPRAEHDVLSLRNLHLFHSLESIHQVNPQTVQP